MENEQPQPLEPLVGPQYLTEDDKLLLRLVAQLGPCLQQFETTFQVSEFILRDVAFNAALLVDRGKADGAADLEHARLAWLGRFPRFTDTLCVLGPWRVARLGRDDYSPGDRVYTRRAWLFREPR